MVRYSYDAKLAKGSPVVEGGGVDINGDPITPPTTDKIIPTIPFKCDYQPTVNTPLFDATGTFARVSYILYVSTSEALIDADGHSVQLENGDVIECNGVKGTTVAIFPTKTNIKVWVR